MKTLVLYFTAEKGNTEKVAQEIADYKQLDIFKIEPKVKYSKSDLNYLNPLSRVNKEKVSNKPIEILKYPENFNEYEKIIIGFPIWYAGAPNIVSQFCDHLDFTNKTVAVFATSMAAPIGKSAQKLAPHINNTKVISSVKLNKDDIESIHSWVDTII